MSAAVSKTQVSEHRICNNMILEQLLDLDEATQALGDDAVSVKRGMLVPQCCSR